LAKLTEGGLTEIIGAVPVPDNDRFSGELWASLVIDICPETGPGAVGANEMLTVRLCDAEMATGNGGPLKTKAGLLMFMD